MNAATEAVQAGLGTVVTVTFFTDRFATTKTEQLVALPDLVRLIERTTAPSKLDLPWLKLARFGDIPSDNGSLRHDRNLRAITGIEADYDAERITFEEAVATLTAAGILCIIYTSPSHAEDSPRWRVLCPLSQPWWVRPRDRFLARLNGVFGGVFAAESWTLSQSYYFGSVRRNPSHRVVLLDCTPIDRMTELDAIAIGKPVKAAPATRPTYPAADPSRVTDRRLNGLVNRLLANISNAPKHTVHNTLLIQARTLGGYAHLLPYGDEELIGMLLRALPSDPDPDPKTERQTALDGLRHGKASPLRLEERPYGWRARA